MYSEVRGKTGRKILGKYLSLSVSRVSRVLSLLFFYTPPLSQENFSHSARRNHKKCASKMQNYTYFEKDPKTHLKSACFGFFLQFRGTLPPYVGVGGDMGGMTPPEGPKTTPPPGGPPYVVLFPPPGCRRRLKISIFTCKNHPSLKFEKNFVRVLPYPPLTKFCGLPPVRSNVASPPWL